jgi:hypothetical protein
MRTQKAIPEELMEGLTPFASRILVALFGVVNAAAEVDSIWITEGASLEEKEWAMLRLRHALDVLDGLLVDT